MARRRFHGRRFSTSRNKLTRWVGARLEDNVVSTPGAALQAATTYTLVAATDYANTSAMDLEGKGATLLRTVMHIHVDATVLLEDDVALTRDTVLVSMALIVLHGDQGVLSPNDTQPLSLEDYLWTCQRAIRLCTNAAGNLRSNEMPERPYAISETFDVRVKRKLDRATVGLIIDVESLGDPDPTTVYAVDILGTSRCLLGGNF